MEPFEDVTPLPHLSGVLFQNETCYLLNSGSEKRVIRNNVNETRIGSSPFQPDVPPHSKHLSTSTLSSRRVKQSNNGPNGKKRC